MTLLQIIGPQYFVPILLFLMGQTVLFLVACVTIYTRIMTRLKELEVRVNMVEKNESEIFNKLDRVLEAAHRIEVQLGGKQDKAK